MDSLTKRRVSDDELAAIVDHGFGTGACVAAWDELTDGSYSAAYAVTLDDGQELILKIAPPPDLKLLTHEVDLMRTEVEVYAQCASVGVPAPAVVVAGFDRRVLGTDYVFLTRVPGEPLDQASETMTDGERQAAIGQAAALGARLHRVTGTAFGYPLRGSGTWRPTWRAAFGAMTDDLIADAERLGAPLPTAPERIAALMRRHADALDEVRRPALVHFDLWEGNIFVARTPGGGWRVTGLIDAERAFYGDPVAELVSLTLLREVEEMPDVLDGFAAGSGEPLRLTGPVRRRIALYRSYLYLIMAIEGRTRGWEDRDWIGEPLDTQLALLAAGSPGR